MKLLKAEVENFGSYKHLEFSFSDLGLALVHGPTGAGKSTLMDIAPWCLFGVTAKDGAVDDVRNWSNLNQPTKGTIYVETIKGTIYVTRVRGHGKGNDLYWVEEGVQNRGKDITETQKLLNERLGTDATLYLLGAYSCEASPSGKFFESKARDRRVLLERCTDLSLPVTLEKRCTDARRDSKARARNLSTQLASASGALTSLRTTYERHTKQGKQWEEKQAQVIKELEAKDRGFEEEKSEEVSRARNQAADTRHHASAALKENERCGACGARNEEYYEAMQERALERHNHELALKDLAVAEARHNPYPEQLKAERARPNPYTESVAQSVADIEKVKGEVDDTKRLVDQEAHTLLSLEQLSDLTTKLRGVLLTTAVREVEAETNRILEAYFSGEFRVAFTVDDSDNLEVEITKNSYQCTFRQLSKGQKQLLRLCFSVALMKRVSAQSGVQFDNIFLDEPADGADAEIKTSAFRLFEELAIGRDSVLVIDHATEFKELFSRKLSVSLQGDFSNVEEA